MLFDVAIVYSPVYWFHRISLFQTTGRGDTIVQVGGGAELHYCADYADRGPAQTAYGDESKSQVGSFFSVW